MEIPDVPVEPAVACVPECKLKPKKKRTMTPELLQKLKLARDRAAELRAIALETKNKIPLPEKERSKVAKYLTERKNIKAQIKQELLDEIEKEPSVVEPQELKLKKVKIVEPDTDSDDEYTTIKVSKKKLIKWNSKEKA